MGDRTGSRPGPARHVRDWAWLAARSTPDPETDCRIWHRNTNHKGYGLFRYTAGDGVHTGSAHRLALELRLGRPLAPGMDACHRCDNPPCVNPAHLFEGSRAENLEDCRNKGRAVMVRGDDNGQAKLRWEDVPEILAALAGGETQASCAQRFGVNQSQISRIKTSQAWTEKTNRLKPRS